MGSSAADRQKERHKRMLERGFKKRAFYVNKNTLQKLTDYKMAKNLDSLDDALNRMLSDQQP